MEKTLPHRSRALRHLEFSSDGVTLAAVDDAGMIEIWNVAGGSIEKTIDTGAGVTALRFSPNGQSLATANANFSVTLWNRNWIAATETAKT